MTKTKVDFTSLSAVQCIEHAIKDFYKNCKGVTDVKTVREFPSFIQIKAICNDMQDILFEITPFTAKNQHENYTRYYLVRAYRLSVDKIQVKHDTYTIERIEGNMGYYLLEYNAFIALDHETDNPYKFSKLDYEYIFREHDIQGV